jgi:hypothetical protein
VRRLFVKAVVVGIIRAKQVFHFGIHVAIVITKYLIYMSGREPPQKKVFINRENIQVFNRHPVCVRIGKVGKLSFQQPCMGEIHFLFTRESSFRDPITAGNPLFADPY